MSDEADYPKCAQVEETVQRIMETKPPSIAWMTGELGNRLLSAFSAARTSLFMRLMRDEKLPRDEAERSANMQWALLAFELGMRVGAEMESVRSMREMFGDDFPEAGP